MYSQKLNYMKKCIGHQDDCLSGVLKKQAECGAPISTPCICHFPHGVDVVDSESSKQHEKLMCFTTQEKKGSSKDVVKMKARQLQQWPIEKIQRSVNKCHTPLEVWSLWPIPAVSWHMAGNIPPLTRISARKGFITILNDPPLIYDNNFLRTHLDLRSKSLHSLPDDILGILKKYRYVNYVIGGINKSNFKEYFVDGFIKVVENFTNYFPVRVAKLKHIAPELGSGFRMMCLVDTVSISFYRLKDVIPIFDYKNTKGVVMEIFITSSSVTGPSLFEAGKSITGLFIFGHSSENITFLDGVPINTMMTGKKSTGKVHSPLDLVASYPAVVAASIPNGNVTSANNI